MCSLPTLMKSLLSFLYFIDSFLLSYMLKLFMDICNSRMVPHHEFLEESKDFLELVTAWPGYGARFHLGILDAKKTEG